MKSRQSKESLVVAEGRTAAKTHHFRRSLMGATEGVVMSDAEEYVGSRV